MKFKIEVNPYSGDWEVSLKHGIFGKWQRVKNITQAPQHFKTYDEVVAFIKGRGIDKIYRFHKSIFHYNPVGHEEPPAYLQNNAQPNLTAKAET